MPGKKILVLGGFFAVLLPSCQRDEQCYKWSNESAAAASISTFGSCGDSGERAVRCKRVEQSWDCSCVLNGIEEQRFTHVGSMPGSASDAEKFANASCSWKLSH